MEFSTRKAVYLLAIILYFVACAECAFKTAPTCARLECAEYSVIHSQKEYEIRTYKDAQWLSGPTVPSNSYKQAARIGYFALSSYFKGNNTANVKWNMTAPALIDVRNSTYTMFLRVPNQYQSNIPTPISNEVVIVKLPKYKYAAVRRFDGFLTDDVIQPQIDALKKGLKGSPYEKAVGLDLPTMVAYNAPFRTVDRVNEVFLWFD